VKDKNINVAPLHGDNPASGTTEYLRDDINQLAGGLDEYWRTRLLPWVDRIDELRAVLAPLLDDPNAPRSGDGEYDFGCCVFCHCEVPGTVPGEHAPDCPVLRKDELLGR